MASSNLSKNIRSKNKTFNFPSLPYICQKRFAEICDAPTLKNFAEINSFTRRLARGRHFVKSALITYDGQGLCTTFKLSCYSNNENNKYCRELENTMESKNKIEVIGTISIQSNKKIGVHFLQLVSISYEFVDVISITVHKIEFSALKKMVNTNIFWYNFCGKIIFDCTIDDFKKFFETLLTIKRVILCIILPNYSSVFTQDLISYGSFLHQKGHIKIFKINNELGSLTFVK